MNSAPTGAPSREPARADDGDDAAPEAHSRGPNAGGPYRAPARGIDAHTRARGGGGSLVWVGVLLLGFETVRGAQNPALTIVGFVALVVGVALSLVGRGPRADERDPDDRTRE